MIYIMKIIQRRLSGNMETKKLEKYLIKKDDKTDMLSSLEKVDKKIIDKKLKEYDIKTIKELAKYIIEEFKETLEMTKDDMLTQMFFSKLVNNENSMIFSAYESDVEDFFVFVYDKGSYYTYYISDEIRKIIKQKLRVKAKKV